MTAWAAVVLFMSNLSGGFLCCSLTDLRLPQTADLRQCRPGDVAHPGSSSSSGCDEFLLAFLARRPAFVEHTLRYADLHAAAAARGKQVPVTAPRRRDRADLDRGSLATLDRRRLG